MTRGYTAFGKEKLMAKRCEIKCFVRPGLFKDEWIVRISIITADGQIREAESIVYGDSLVREGSPNSQEEVPGRLSVYCVNRMDDKAAVVLPQTTIENGPCVIVPETELIAS